MSNGDRCTGGCDRCFDETPHPNGAYLAKYPEATLPRNFASGKAEAEASQAIAVVVYLIWISVLFVWFGLVVLNVLDSPSSGVIPQPPIRLRFKIQFCTFVVNPRSIYVSDLFVKLVVRTY